MSIWDNEWVKFAGMSSQDDLMIKTIIRVVSWSSKESLSEYCVAVETNVGKFLKYLEIGVAVTNHAIFNKVLNFREHQVYLHLFFFVEVTCLKVVNIKKIIIWHNLPQDWYYVKVNIFTWWNECMNSPAKVQFLLPLKIAESTIANFGLRLQSRDKNIK